jgi:hypothetical protein
MALLDVRRRSGYLFLAVIVGHVILISAQVNSKSGVPVLEQVTFGVFAEAQRGLSTGVSNIRRAWNRYVWLRGVEAQNADLRRQLDEVRVQYQERSALADRASHLEEVLTLRDRTNLQTAASDVIASSASPDFRTLTIDKGTNHGFKLDMAVIARLALSGASSSRARAPRKSSCSSTATPRPARSSSGRVRRASRSALEKIGCARYVSEGRRRRRRSRGDVRDRRHLPEGLHDRAGGHRRKERPA